MKTYIIISEPISFENLKDLFQRENELEKIARKEPIRNEIIRNIRIYCSKKGKIAYEVQDLEEEGRKILDTQYLSPEKL